MVKDERRAFINLLRKMSKRGFYETLQYIHERGRVHYADILNYNLKSRVVESRATVTLTIRELAKLGLVQRTIVDSRPIRTVYQVTEKGQKLLQHLNAIKQLT